ncbi:MAG: ArdC-like ssDNA-binding domain-containing protein [Pseudooceanicola sp.]
MSRDIYQEVTSAIIDAIEKNPGDPVMPWHRGGANQVPKNAATGNEYQGVNILNLWITAQAAGFESNEWATYRQLREVGAQVRKGEMRCP